MIIPLDTSIQDHGIKSSLCKVTHKTFTMHLNIFRFAFCSIPCPKFQLYVISYPLNIYSFLCYLFNEYLLNIYTEPDTTSR